MKKNKAYWKLNATELRKATREFDREGIAETFGPPTAAAKQALQRAAKLARSLSGV